MKHEYDERLERKVELNYIQQLISCLIENTLNLYSKDKLVDLFREIGTVYWKNQTRALNKLCGHHAELLMLKQVLHIE
jgi:hypothetical protein